MNTYSKTFDVTKYQRLQNHRSCLFRRILLTSSFLWLLLSVNAQAQLLYKIDNAAMSENRLGASLILNESKTEQRLISRAKAWGSTDQIDSPHCNGIPLVQDQEGFWLAPAGCQEVAWSILLDQAIQGQSRMDEQQSTKLLPRLGLT